MTGRHMRTLYKVTSFTACNAKLKWCTLMTDPRDLIRLLTEKLDHLHCHYNIPNQSALIAEARNYLAQPEPEGLTLEELNDLCADHGFVFDDNHGEGLSILSDIVNAALARWGQDQQNKEAIND